MDTLEVGQTYEVLDEEPDKTLTITRLTASMVYYDWKNSREQGTSSRGRDTYNLWIRREKLRLKDMSLRGLIKNVN